MLLPVVTEWEKPHLILYQLPFSKRVSHACQRDMFETGERSGKDVQERLAEEGERGEV